MKALIERDNFAFSDSSPFIRSMNSNNIPAANQKDPIKRGQLELYAAILNTWFEIREPTDDGAV
jgi:hypothetical protein